MKGKESLNGFEGPAGYVPAMPPEVLARLFIPVAATLLLSGCATKMQRKLHGRPVAEAVAVMGPPTDISDPGRGRRLFQWSLSDVRIEWEEAKPHEPTMWTSDPTPIHGYRIGPCAISVFAHWDERQGTWVTHKYQRIYPETCGMRAVPRPFRPISYLKD